MEHFKNMKSVRVIRYGQNTKEGKQSKSKAKAKQSKAKAKQKQTQANPLAAILNSQASFGVS